MSPLRIKEFLEMIGRATVITTHLSEITQAEILRFTADDYTLSLTLPNEEQQPQPQKEEKQVLPVVE